MAAGRSLLLQEYFDAADSRFLDELLAATIDKKLGAFAEKWSDDSRPWAREMLFRYIDDGCNRSGHRLLVKRLYKLAEKRKDDELVAHFAVAFDRYLGRKLRTEERCGIL